ncbi:hypothetical protein ACOSQ3_005191 [Xanthoceras sorbifolium]
MDPNIGQPCWKRYESVTDLCMGRALLALRRLCIGLHLISKITFWLTRAQLLLRLLFILLCMVLLVGLPHLVTKLKLTLTLHSIFMTGDSGLLPAVLESDALEVVNAVNSSHSLADLGLYVFYIQNIFALFLGSSVGFVPHEANQAVHAGRGINLSTYSLKFYVILLVVWSDLTWVPNTGTHQDLSGIAII